MRIACSLAAAPAAPGRTPGRYEPVVRSSSPSSLAWRSLDRKMAVAASVASAPVTHNARTMVVASGAAEPVTAVHSDPSPPIDDGPSGATARRTPATHQVTGLMSPMTSSDVGQDGEREHDARDQEQRPGERVRVRPALLARLEADRGQQHADREDRHDAQHQRDPEQRPVDRREVDPQPEHDDREHERDERAHRAGREPGPAAPDEQHEERGRRDVQVLEHPVALAVLEDRPRRPRDPGHEHRPQRGPEDDERPDRVVAGAGGPRPMIWIIITSRSRLAIGLTTV